MAHKSRNVVLALLESEDSGEFKNWLNDLLHRGPVVVEFTKVDGTTRIMQCTLNESLIASMASTNTKGDTMVKRERVVSPDVRTVWDIQGAGWRSFRWGSLVNVSWDDGEQE